MTTAITKTNDELASGFLKKFGTSLENYAMRKYDQNSFLKSAMIALVESPKLIEVLKTSAGKLSIFNALRYAATTGLSLNPQEGKAALIVYKGAVGYQIMKNGMIDLAMESGKVEFLTADYVRENDHFELKKSIHGDDYDFRPAKKERGNVLGFLAALKLKSGGTHVKWMTAEETEEHRKTFSQYAQMPEIGYGLKTVIKALLRNISISDELDNAIGAEDFFNADFTDSPGVTADKTVEKLEKQKKDVVIDGQNDLL